MLALAPASASAATYEVQLCADPGAPGFTASNDSPATLATVAECPPRTGDSFSGMAVAVKPGALGPAPGAGAGWTVAAPDGTTLRALHVRRKLDKTDANYEVVVRTAEGAVLDDCPFGDECSEVVTRTYRPAPTRSISFRVGCAAAAAVCGNSPAGTRALLVVNEATATLDDPDPPLVSTPVTGWQRTTDVPIVADDVSGVSSVALAGGALREQVCDFTHLQPCPGSVRTSVPADVPDGVHALTAVATDAAGQSQSAPVTLRLDRRAPGAPAGLAVQHRDDGTFVYTWRNPDQGGMAPIAAAHYSDGITETVVRASDIARLEAATGDGRVWLEDEAGNADPASAARVGGTTAIAVKSPILQTTAPSPRLRITRAARSGRTLIIRGTIARGATARVTATLTRGKRALRKSAKPQNGRWTIQIRLTPALRRSGTNTLTIRYGGQAGYAPATVRKRLRV